MIHRSLVVALLVWIFAPGFAVAAPIDGAPQKPAADSSTPNIGVVDLDKVAADLGWTARLQSDQKLYVEQLKKELFQVAERYRGQITSKRRSYGGKDTDPLTADQQQTLMSMTEAYNQMIQQLDQQAGQRLTNYSQERIKRYREALSPVVRQLAQDKKLKLVLTQMGGIAYADPEIDLTNGVIDAARANPPKVVEPPMAPLTAPEELPALGVPTSQPIGAGPTTRPAPR